MTFACSVGRRKHQRDKTCTRLISDLLNEFRILCLKIAVHNKWFIFQFITDRYLLLLSIKSFDVDVSLKSTFIPSSRVLVALNFGQKNIFHKNIGGKHRILSGKQ